MNNNVQTLIELRINAIPNALALVSDPEYHEESVVLKYTVLVESHDIAEEKPTYFITDTSLGRVKKATLGLVEETDTGVGTDIHVRFIAAPGEQEKYREMLIEKHKEIHQRAISQILEAVAVANTIRKAMAHKDKVLF